MFDYLLNLFTKFRIWTRAKVQESKQPLSRENAYVLSTLNKMGKYENVKEHLFKIVLDDIKTAARIGDTYALIKYPSYASSTNKEELLNYLIIDLGYSVCYNDSEVLLISWKYSKEDFDMCV